MIGKALLTQGRIGVLMGGQSSEREVSLRTGAAVHRALCRRGYDAVTIDVGSTLSRELQDQKIDVAFLALHGPGGEDGSIQGFLETVGFSPLTEFPCRWVSSSSVVNGSRVRRHCGRRNCGGPWS